MSKTFVIHGIWFVVAAGALAFGRFVLPGTDAELNGDDLSAAEQELQGIGGGKSAGAKLRARKESAGSKNELVNPVAVGSAPVSISAYLDEDDPLKANAMFANLLLSLTPSNAREMFDSLNKSSAGGREGGQRMGLLLEAWARLDGAAAVEAISELGGDGRRRAFASMSALTGWAMTDPNAAIAHASTVENGWEKGMMMQGIVTGLARTDPNAATEYVLALEADRQANGTGEGNRDDRWRGYAVDRQMEAIATSQLRQGISTATAWAENLPAGDLKASAFDQVAERYVQDDPAAAARWVEAHAGEEYAGRAVREIAEEYARTDPESAIDWAVNLPDASQRGAISETLERWTREDAPAASNYLDQMTESPARDTAVSSFARELDRQDPQTAATWAGTIDNPELRNETLQSVARSWMRSNREEAVAWLPNSGLTAEAQQEITAQASRDGGDQDRRRGR